MASPPTDLCFLPAVTLVRLIAQHHVSAREVIEAHIAQIDQVNPALNAIVTRVPDQARAHAAHADVVLARGGPIGPLHGLPIAHKDLVLTKGLRTTFGSKAFEHFVPDEDALLVERVRAAGAITIGKTNTPEFGAGSQTFNDVFGTTRNPYDPTKTCGGSSGGAAVALATGMLPLADGTDMGGSLRNPASFCNVVGMRPSPGRVPVWPRPTAWFPSPSVSGPMARTVSDVALMLSVLAGPDPRDPQSLADAGTTFARPLGRNFSGVRVAWTKDLGGLPFDARVTEVIGRQRSTLESLGCIVEDAAPDLSDADDIFKVWRAWYFELAYGEVLDTHPAQLQDSVVWNVEQGRQLTGPRLGEIERQRTELYHRVRTFMDNYEFMVLPVSQVPPFDISQPYVTEIGGTPMDTYIDWMRSCYYITVTGLPALSVPAGFTQDGLPVGLQIVGRHHGDFGVLQLAEAFEQATGFWKERPPTAGQLS